MAEKTLKFNKDEADLMRGILCDALNRCEVRMKDDADVADLFGLALLHGAIVSLCEKFFEKDGGIFASLASPKRKERADDGKPGAQG